MRISKDQIFGEFEKELIHYLSGLHPSHQKIIINELYYFQEKVDAFKLLISHSNNGRSYSVDVSLSRSISPSTYENLYKHIKLVVRDNKLNDILK